MKTICLLFFGFLLAGCAGSRPGAALTAEQATVHARQLANEKARGMYHCQPFRGNQPAQLVSGHWHWKERGTAGHIDIEAQVEMAADGSAPSVDLKVWDNQMPLSSMESR